MYQECVLQCAATVHSYELKTDRHSQIALGKKKKTTEAIFKRFNLSPIKEQQRYRILDSGGSLLDLLSSLSTPDPPATGLKKTHSSNFMASE